MTVAELHVRNLTLSFDRRPAIHHLNFSLNRGDVLGIIGPNGSGKSTLLRAIEGLIAAPKSSIDLPRIKPYQLGSLPQQNSLDLSFPVTVLEAIRMGLLVRCGLLGGITTQAHENLKHAIAFFGLESLAQRNLRELSGGQLQRVLWARLMVMDAQVILLDEPMTFLDDENILRAQKLIENWKTQNKTILIADHSLSLLQKLATQVLVLAREQLAFGAAEDIWPRITSLSPTSHLNLINLSPEFCKVEGTDEV